MRGGVLLLAGVALFASAPILPASAGTLRDALIQTYKTNPTITAERAQVRSLDEGVEIARAGNRLNVSGTAAVTQGFNGLGTLNSNGRSVTGGLNVNYPLFNGGRVRNAVRGADSRVEAGRADLRATEGSVFTQAVSAYEDVIRDTSIVQLNENQVKVLQTNLESTKDQFEVGNLTRTDVAQSEARLAGARSDLAVARGNLTTSQENYVRIIGAAPGMLEPPPPLPPLPTSADASAEVALKNSPDILSAQATTQASRYDVSVARAARLPTIGAGAGVNYNNYLGTLDNAVGIPGAPVDQVQTNSTVGLTATVPLYQGGGVAAQVRQYQALESQAIEQGVAVERQVIANARSAFASYVASQEAIESSNAAVSANQLALEGVQAEQGVGTRTILEVLNAEQELLNSRVTLVTAEHDHYVAGFALLNAMGQAELADLNLEGTGPLYDPQANYRRIRGRWSDWRDDPTPVATATPTLIGPPAPIDAPPVSPPPNHP